MTTTSYDCDVLVVGLGPVGATLAALLSKAGICTIALDKDTEVYPLPRAAHFDHEIMRVFQRLGLADEILPHTRRAPAYEFQTADGEVLMRFDLPFESPSAWSTGYMFHQPGVENALRKLLSSSQHSDMRLAHSFVSLAQDEDGVTAQVETPQGPSSIRARYLVGCDGASSQVREAIGAPLHDYEFDEPWLVIDVNVPEDAELPDVNLQICDPRRPVTCVLMGPGRHRWEIMMLPGETPDEVLEEGFIRDILSAWDCGEISLERKAVYRFHGLLAKKWREGRVLLAGDAAHQMPPFAGQGMCSGIRDAVNLAWKLEAALKTEAASALLDAYQEEREPHIAATIEFSIGMGRVVCTLDKAEAAARDKDMLARQAAGEGSLPAPGTAAIASGVILAGSAAAGSFFPQFHAPEGGTRLLLDDVLGEGPWLISASSVNATSPVASFTLSSSKLTPFRAPLEAWLSENEAEAVLVRPDRFVFGTGAPASLVGAWEQMLRGA